MANRINIGKKSIVLSVCREKSLALPINKHHAVYIKGHNQQLSDLLKMLKSELHEFVSKASVQTKVAKKRKNSGQLTF